MVLSYLLGFEPPFLLLVAVGLVVILVVSSWTRVPENAPPCPARPYPILGHLPYLGGDPRGKMLEWSRTVGDIYSVYMGLNHVVVLGSYDVMKETIIKQADVFSGRPHAGTMDALTVEDGIVSTSGPVWKENRTTSLSILRSFGMGSNLMAQKIMDEVVAYLDEIAKLGGKAADVRNITFRTTSNVICNVLIGKRFEYDDEYYGRFIDIFEHQLENFSVDKLHVVFPWVKHLPGDMFGAKKTIENDELILKFADEFIEKVKSDEIRSDNFIAQYLEEVDKKREAGKATILSRNHLRRLVNELLMAGSETTSTTILWFYLYMLHYPDVQKKVYEEIVREIGTERSPNMGDKPRLPFTSATILEVQRVASIVPFGITHRCEADVTVRGYTIPQDTSILLHLDAVLLDDRTWGDATTFRPDRFLDSKGELTKPEEHIAFSLGRRVCLGEALARMELFLILVSVLQRYQVTTSDPASAPPPIRDRMGIACSPQPYKLRFLPRGEGAGQ